MSFVRYLICLFIAVLLASCNYFARWQHAQATITLADSLDQSHHVLYDDTMALHQVIHTLNHPLGRLFAHNQLGKAHYYLGRHLSNEGTIPEAAAHYILADRLRIDNPLYRGRINSCLAHIAKQNESDSLALLFFQRANAAFCELTNTFYYAHTLLDVSEFHTYLHNFNKADSVLIIAKSFALDSFYIARYYETKGLYFYEQLQCDSAVLYFHRALDFWQYEEDKFFTFKKLMQVYLDMDDFEHALPYAQTIVELSNDPNDLVNAYYCLMQDAKAQNDINRLSEYAHARQDANVLLNSAIGQHNGALTLLEEYVANPYPYRWVWIMLFSSIVLCLFLLMGIALYRRHVTRRLQASDNQLQVANTQISDLYLSALLSDIRAKYPRPRKQWNDYNELKKDLDAQLHDWLYQLESYQLSNRENIFCTYMLLYPNASLEALADWMHYSPTGISTFKRRVAQKIGIPTRELYKHLYNILQETK